MQKDLVSIVVPFYNAYEYLQRCLNSLVNQTYRNLEIILVNDMSTDESPSVCQKYLNADKRVCIYNKDQQGGPAAARNYGINRATGKYIYFMDADDVLDLNAIEALYSEYQRLSPDLVMGNVKRINMFGVCEYDWRKKDSFYKTRDDVVKLVASFMYDIKSNKVFWSA